MLFVHGGPDWDHSYLLPAAEKIARDRRVILFDLRGCGRSSATPNLSDYSVKAAANDVVTIVRSIGTPVHLLGFSFGGRIAIRAVQNDPQYFASLILASTTPGGDVEWKNEPHERIERRAGIQSVSEALSDNTSFDASFTKRLAINGLPLDVWNLDEIPRIRRLLDTVLFSGEWGKAWKAGLLVPDNQNYTTWLKGTALPKLILHAQYDFRFPMEAFSGLQDSQNVRMRTISNAGHLAPLEQPDIWSKTLTKFLNDVENGHLI